MIANPFYSKLPYFPGITGSSFGRFYPYYLGEHSNRTCRRLHVIGTTAVVSLLVAAVLGPSLTPLLYAPIVGYGTAWVGHFFFEKNRPATFKHPLYSLAGDFKLWKETVTGQRPF